MGAGAAAPAPAPAPPGSAPATGADTTVTPCAAPACDSKARTDATNRQTEQEGCYYHEEREDTSIHWHVVTTWARFATLAGVASSSLLLLLLLLLDVVLVDDPSSPGLRLGGRIVQLSRAFRLCVSVHATANDTAWSERASEGGNKRAHKRAWVPLCKVCQVRDFPL